MTSESKAKKLSSHVLENFAEEKQLNKFIEVSFRESYFKDVAQTKLEIDNLLEGLL